MKKRLFLAIFVIVCLVFGSSSGYAANEVPTVMTLEQAIHAVNTSIPEDNFGGMYVDENGDLIVHLVDNSKDTSNPSVQMPFIVGNDFTTKYDYVKYTLTELETMKNSLEPYMYKYGIATLDADEVNGTITIELFDATTMIDVEKLIDRLYCEKLIDKEIISITALPNDMEIVFTMKKISRDEAESLEKAVAATTTVYPGTFISIGVSASGT